MESKLNDFITMLRGRIAWDSGCTYNEEIIEVYNKILQDIEEIKEKLNELDSKEY